MLACSLCLQVLDPLTEHLLQLLANNDERLADYGADRTYNIFRCLVNINLPRIIQYCVPDEEQAERSAKVGVYRYLIGFFTRKPPQPAWLAT
jgi:hypothetical protein